MLKTVQTSVPTPSDVIEESGRDFMPIIRPTLPEWSAVQALMQEAWSSGVVTTGPITRKFEEEVEAALRVPHAVMLNHGATALMLGIRALQLSGEVIIPPFTWTATASALLWNGVTPVLADIARGRLTLDPDAAEAAITPRTTAIMPVNVFGVPPDIEAFERIAERHGLKLLLDSAQGLGATYHGVPHGGFGNAECFSLSPTKVVTAMEGGLFTTHDGELASIVRSMRDSGKNNDGSDIIHVGMSGRPTEMNAAVGLLSFRNRDNLIAARMERIAWYREDLLGVPGISFQCTPPDVQSTGNYAVIFVDDSASMSRDKLYLMLKSRQIQTKKYFSPAIHLQTAYSQLRPLYEGKLPVAEAASNTGLALPLYSHMSRQDVSRVTDFIRRLIP